MSVKICLYISVYRVILSCCNLELIQYKHFCKLTTVNMQLSFEQLQFPLSCRCVTVASCFCMNAPLRLKKKPGKNLNQEIDPTGGRTRTRCVRGNDATPKLQRCQISVIYPPAMQYVHPPGLTKQIPMGQMLEDSDFVPEHQTGLKEWASLNLQSAESQGHCQRKHRTEHRQRTHNQSQDRYQNLRPPPESEPGPPGSKSGIQPTTPRRRN